MQKAKNLNDKQRAALLKLLQERFEENKRRHPGLQWAKVQAKLVANPAKVRALSEMERTGGSAQALLRP